MRYQSNLEAPDMEQVFKHVHVNPAAHGHDTLGDDDFNPACGYVSHDEAAILYHVALRFKGPWLEVGSHTGWSACHIAKGGGIVTGLDPEFHRPEFFLRAYDNIAAAGEADCVCFVAGTAESFFTAYPERKFCGAFIDGNHDEPCPTVDASLVIPHLEDRAVVLFHDFIGDPVQNAVRFMIGQGFSFRIYNTPQMIAACWRGDNVKMPDHVPDPAADWVGVRRQMAQAGFDFRGEQ